MTTMSKIANAQKKLLELEDELALTSNKKIRREITNKIYVYLGRINKNKKLLEAARRMQ